MMLLIDDGQGGVRTIEPSHVDRLRSRIAAHRLDRELANGASPDTDVVVALHARRLVGMRERRRVADGLTRALLVSTRPLGAGFASTVVDRQAVVGAAADVLDLCRQLVTPGPVSVRGVACVRALLSNGVGPLYDVVPGDRSAPRCGTPPSCSTSRRDESAPERSRGQPGSSAAIVAASRSASTESGSSRIARPKYSPTATSRCAMTAGVDPGSGALRSARAIVHELLDALAHRLARSLDAASRTTGGVPAKVRKIGRQVSGSPATIAARSLDDVAQPARDVARSSAR